MSAIADFIRSTHGGEKSLDGRLSPGEATPVAPLNVDRRAPLNTLFELAIAIGGVSLHLALAVDKNGDSLRNSTAEGR